MSDNYNVRCNYCNYNNYNAAYLYTNKITFYVGISNQLRTLLWNCVDLKHS